MKDEKIRTTLRQENAEFIRLEEKHRQYDELIQRFSSQTFLTEHEKLEEKRIKKLKLHLKDQMNDMILKYKNAQKVCMGGD
jgi:uncharacterized protein YdcH (DUF465 family)